MQRLWHLLAAGDPVLICLLALLLDRQGYETTDYTSIYPQCCCCSCLSATRQQVCWFAWMRTSVDVGQKLLHGFLVLAICIPIPLQQQALLECHLQASHSGRQAYGSVSAVVRIASVVLAWHLDREGQSEGCRAQPHLLLTSMTLFSKKFETQVIDVSRR